MAFWDRLKKRKKDSEKTATPETREMKKETDEMVIKKKDESVRSQKLGVLLRPSVTEKTAKAGEENKYVFVVNKKSNKIDIKKEVETRYDVLVRSVNIINISGKKRHRGRQVGWKPGYKKAIVTLKEGQSIEIQ